MFKSLTLKNFRSYKDVHIEFSSGVNIITGENDSGKTNLLRAINLVVNNRPSGVDYISNWGGDLQVDLETEDKTVSRIRSVKWSKKRKKYEAGEINAYKLSGEAELFASFGMGVPELIKKYLNMSSSSFAFQLEGPFLLNKSAADVARHYNNIVNLDVIDTTISSIASTLRSERFTLKIEEENKKDLIHKLKKYDWLNEAETNLLKLEQIQTSVEQLETDKLKLSVLMEESIRLEKTKQELNTIVQHDETVAELQQLNRTIRILAKDRFDLQELINRHKKLTEKNQHFAWVIDHAHAVDSLITQNRTIVNLRQESNVLKTLVFQMKQLVNKEEIYRSIMIHENKVNELIELSKKIVTETKERIALNYLIMQHEKLSATYAQSGETIERFEKKFKEAIPEMCPIFDVQCDYIDKAKQNKGSTTKK